MTNNRADRNSEQNKPERIPVSGIRDIMTVLNKDPNFAYRFVLDKDEAGSRIMRFKRGWWDFARADDFEGVSVGSESVYKSKQDGSIVRFPSGEGHFSYLMKIEKKYYDEDQQAKWNKIDEVEQTITRTGTTPDGEAIEGKYGSVKISRTRDKIG